MKTLKTAMLISLCLMFVYLASCSKKHDVMPTGNSSTAGTTINNTNVAGYWFGSAYGGQFNQSFLLRADGTVKVYDFYYNPTSKDTTQAYDGTGTYTLRDDVITVNTKFPDGEAFSSSAQINLTANPATMTFSTANNGYNGDVYKKQ